MSTRRNFWPYLAGTLTGIAAIISAMSLFAGAVGGDTQTNSRTGPTAREHVANLSSSGDDRLKKNDKAAPQVQTMRIAAQAAKDNAGRLHKLGLAQNAHLSQPAAWLLAEATYEDASQEMGRASHEVAELGFKRAAEHYEEAIRLSTAN